jgi:transposase
MDNASFYYSEQIGQMCFNIGVKLVYLPPYLPDLNLIKEFFAKLTLLLGGIGSPMRKTLVKGLITSLSSVLTW